MVAIQLENSVQRRLSRRTRLPSPMDPQPLVRVAPNPGLEHVIALLSQRKSVCAGILVASDLQLRPEVQNVLSFRSLPQHEPRKHRCSGLQRHARQPGRSARGDPKEPRELARRRSHIGVHQNASNESILPTVSSCIKNR